MNWLRVLLQSVTFFEATKYWRVVLGAFAVLLALIGIACGSTATIVLAAFLGFIAVAQVVL
jgi:hypothetical protein